MNGSPHLTIGYLQKRIQNACVRVFGDQAISLDVHGMET